MANPGDAALTPERLAAIKAALAEFTATDRHEGSIFAAKVQLAGLLDPTTVAALVDAVEERDDQRALRNIAASLADGLAVERDALAQRVAALEAERGPMYRCAACGKWDWPALHPHILEFGVDDTEDGPRA